MKKLNVVVFSNDNRKVGVDFPEAEITEDKFGNVKFDCRDIDLINFIANNGFTVQEESTFDDGTGKFIYILKGTTVMGQYWESQDDYETYLSETKDCY